MVWIISSLMPGLSQNQHIIHVWQSKQEKYFQLVLCLFKYAVQIAYFCPLGIIYFSKTTFFHELQRLQTETCV